MTTSRESTRYDMARTNAARGGLVPPSHRLTPSFRAVALRHHGGVHSRGVFYQDHTAPARDARVFRIRARRLSAVHVYNLDDGCERLCCCMRACVGRHEGAPFVSRTCSVGSLANWLCLSAAPSNTPQRMPALAHHPVPSRPIPPSSSSRSSSARPSRPRGGPTFPSTTASTATRSSWPTSSSRR
jgi:hypothetical protein